MVEKSEHLNGKEDDEEPIIAPDDQADDVGAESENDDDLKAELETVRRNAEATQRALDDERAQRAREQQTAAVALSDTRLQTIANAIDATAGQVKEAQAKRRAALESGDWEAESAANDELMGLKVKQARLSEGKTAIEQQIEQAKDMPTDPVDRYVAALAPAAQAWVRKHPEVVTDPRKNAKLTAAHWDAVGDGIQPNSPEYFALVEERMGYTANHPRQDRQDERLEEPVQERRQSAPAAPPSRDVPNSNGQQRPNTVRLSSREREAADMAGMSYVDYAKERDRLGKAGAFMTKH